MIQQSSSWACYPDKTLIWKDTCSSMFRVALFTIAQTWKQPNCPSTDECVKELWFVYTVGYYSAIKENEILPFAATWMKWDAFMLSEVSQEKNILRCNLYMESKKKMTLFTAQEQTHWHRKQTYDYQIGKSGKRDKLGVLDLWIHTTI